MAAIRHNLVFKPQKIKSPQYLNVLNHDIKKKGIWCFFFYKHHTRIIMIEMIKAIIFGVVEGITEWLPVSSTGHMILLNEFVKLNVSDDFFELFLVVIQLGAIIAVLFLFWNKVFPFSIHDKNFIQKDIFIMWFKIALACIPGVIVEVLWGDQMEALFYNYKTVAIMLILVGIIFIIVENWYKNKEPKITTIGDIS